MKIKKEHLHCGLACAGGVFIGWSINKIFVPWDVQRLIDGANRIAEANEEILDFLVDELDNGELNDNPEFISRLSERLTWVNIVMQEEL